jgi:hypothetical protein
MPGADESEQLQPPARQVKAVLAAPVQPGAVAPWALLRHRLNRAGGQTPLPPGLIENRHVSVREAELSNGPRSYHLARSAGAQTFLARVWLGGGDPTACRAP